MAERQTVPVVVETAELRREYAVVQRLLGDYGRFLAGLSDGADWGPAAAELMHRHDAVLQQSQSSLRSLDLVAALLRKALGLMPAERFRVHPAPGMALEAPAEPMQPDAATAERLGTLLARLNAQVARAPLHLQEKLHRLIDAEQAFFTALQRDDAEGTERALVRVNLITANRRARTLVREIALVTRQVYSSLQSITEEFSVDTLSESSEGASEAIARLNSVIERLEASAGENLDHLDALSQRVPEDRATLERALTGLRRAQHRLAVLADAHPEQAEALRAVQARLADEAGAPLMGLRLQADRNADAYMSLMSSQGIHDMASQTLRRITGLVEQMQSELLGVLHSYRSVLNVDGEARSKAAAPAGDASETPQHPAEAGSQAEVDALLGELGFD